MARPPEPHIRARLRDQAIDYVLRHGVSDLALRPLAKALKTNARMLVYHFGSREGLMREILVALRESEDARIRAWFHSSKNGLKRTRTLAEFLRWYWKRLSTPQARPDRTVDDRPVCGPPEFSQCPSIPLSTPSWQSSPIALQTFP